MRHLHLLTCTLFCLVAASIVGGCAKPHVANAFDGPDRPAGQVARLTIDSPVRLASLDGKVVEGIPAQTANSYGQRPRIVNILPGAHRIVVGVGPLASEANSAPPPGGGLSLGVGFAWNYPGSKEDEALDFNAVAGGRYIVKIKDLPSIYNKSENWRARVIDQDDPQFQKEVSTSAGGVAHVAAVGR